MGILMKHGDLLWVMYIMVVVLFGSLILPEDPQIIWKEFFNN
jgi:hypothetical protein